MEFRKILLSSLAAFLLASPVSRAANPTVLKYDGHAAFEITTPLGHVLLIDPWLRNPMNLAAHKGQDPVQAVKKADYILLTHGHFDHTGDAVEIAKKTKARLVTNFELGANMNRVLGYPKDQMGFDTLGNVGGELTIADGEVTVAFVEAIHSSGLDAPDAEKKNKPVAYGGNPVGFVVKIKNGPTIYHTGDTAYFGDMALIGQNYAPDVALINIGGHFGMTPEMAVKAAQAVKAKWAVPHHYKSFPVLTQDAAPFLAGVKKSGLKGREMAPGDELRFEGARLKD